MRDDCGKQSTGGGIQEGKNERGSRGGWLEAENAQLRGMVAELMLEIQVLREALGHPHLKSDPK